MNKEILKQKEGLVEQAVDQKELEPEPKTENNKPVKQEQIETKESLNKTREKLNKTYEEQKPNPIETKDQIEKQKKINANEFFDVAKSKENNIKLSMIDRTAEFVGNTGSSQEVRDKTAERKILEVIKALGEIGDNLENIKKNVKVILDIGAGWGENLRNLAKELEAEKGIAIDKSTILSKRVKEEVGDKLIMVSGDAGEEIKHLKNNSIDLSMAVALLQAVNKEEKVKILKEMGRISELVVVVDELKRDGLGGFRDLFMNKLYNAGMGKYKVLKEEDWKEIFKEAGLVVVEEVFNKFGKNDFVTVLKKAEEKVEE